MKDRKLLEHIKNKTKTLWYEADEYGNAELNVQASPESSKERTSHEKRN